MTIDQKAFAAGMGLICGAFSRTLDAAVSRSYYAVLNPKMTTEQFEQAVAIVLNRETFWPSPAVLLGTMATDDEAGLLALRHVNSTMGKFGGFQHLPFSEYEKFDDATKAAIKAVGGLSEVANTPHDRYAGLQKRWVKAYDRAGQPQLPGETTDPRVKQLVGSVAVSLKGPRSSGRDRSAGVAADD